MVGYSAGRFGAPTREQTKVVTVERVRIQEHVRVETVVQREQTKAQDRIVNVVRTVTKEGAIRVETQVIYRDREAAKESAAQVQTVDRIVMQDRIVEKDKIVTRDAPRLNLFGGVGVSAAMTGLDVEPVYLLGAQYRALGPLSFGLAGMYEQVVLPASKPRVGAVLTVGIGL